MCVESGEKNDNVNVEEKFGIVQVFFFSFLYLSDNIPRTHMR